MSRRHLSISQIEMHAKCEKQWEYRYVYGIKSPPGVAAVIGKGTHRAIEKNLQQKMTWGVLLDTDELKATAADALKLEWEREAPLLRDDDPTQGQATDTAVALATLHHKVLAPQIEPIALEQAFIIELPQISHDIMGVLDIETATSIRDTKTRAKAPAANAAKRSAQLIGYHLRATIDGHPEKTVALDYLIKNKVPRHETVTAAPTAEDHIAFVNRVELTSKSIDAGIFKPTNPDNWWCTERWCGYWDRCEFGARRSVSVGLIDPTRLTSRLIENPHRDTTDDSDAAA